MRWLAGFLVVLAGLPACAGGAGWAAQLTVAEPEFRDPQVVVATSMPPQLEIDFVRDMPTPGWSFSVDAVTVDETSSRITVKLSDVAPQGAVAQVITPTTCRIPLGQLAPGVYALELWVRRDRQETHTLRQSLVVRAR